ncbi:hypothetical protein SAVCW2_41030 [Streptomyces avermitilis]|uniref:Uncharacterized protein n=1 Tax=Streptomyces avermitilis TaxID=33903 RepID=A0A4D4MUU4_STRAX|nr:hypothetical protein SAV31267_054250 [Streptomyces avermitilis]GDY84904.1 hypothetical protein SAVCW2_41030 [Streptomyces avermitilis]
MSIFWSAWADDDGDAFASSVFSLSQAVAVTSTAAITAVAAVTPRRRMDGMELCPPVTETCHAPAWPGNVPTMHAEGGSVIAGGHSAHNNYRAEIPP